MHPGNVLLFMAKITEILIAVDHGIRFVCGDRRRKLAAKVISITVIQLPLLNQAIGVH